MSLSELMESGGCIEAKGSIVYRRQEDLNLVFQIDC